MIHVTHSENPAQSRDGLRPINLRTDLGRLADLIELVFSDSIDSGGRAALREMRYLSRMGPGLRLLSNLNELAMGVSLGYVWVADGELVGNVSVYPANWPSGLGSAWIIANVGVHPDYQRRGIARRLMRASMDMIAQRGGTTAILQVDADNLPAISLYRSLGFTSERTWINWRRSTYSHIPAPSDSNAYIRTRRRSEWRDEMALARRIRPQEKGGLGWLRPLHPSCFRRLLWQRPKDFFSLRKVERLVIRSADEQRLLASLWIERTLGGKTELTLLVDPLFQGIYDDVLLNTAVRRFGGTPIHIEHPADDEGTNDILARYHFTRQRTVIHMRWDARG